MDAVRCVDTELRRAAGVLHHLVHAGRTVTLRRLRVARQVHGDRHARVTELEVTRLIFLVRGTREEHRARTIERDHAVRRGITNAPRARSLPHARVVGCAVAQRQRRAAFEHVLLEQRERATEQRPELRDAGAKVPAETQLVENP